VPPGSKSAGIRRSAPGYGIGNPHAVGVVVREPKEVKRLSRIRLTASITPASRLSTVKRCAIAGRQTDARVYRCLAKNLKIGPAISSFLSSKAKCPASSKWISASRRSRLNLSPLAAMNDGSFRLQTTKVDDLCARSHVRHAGYEATLQDAPLGRPNTVRCRFIWHAPPPAICWHCGLRVCTRSVKLLFLSLRKQASDFAAFAGINASAEALAQSGTVELRRQYSEECGWSSV
jgi:hypothetical protein